MDIAPILPQPVSILRAHRWKDLPSAPGVYWWYFPEEDLCRFRIAEFCQIDRLNLRRSHDNKICLYHGMATNLANRAAWHAEQALTLRNLRSGFLSTFRFTLLALNDFDYTAGRGQIDRFMDRLSLSWMEAKSVDQADAIEKLELGGEFHYPLNISHNRCAELTKYIHFLKSVRSAYKHRYLASVHPA